MDWGQVDYRERRMTKLGTVLNAHVLLNWVGLRGRWGCEKEAFEKDSVLVLKPRLWVLKFGRQEYLSSSTVN